MFRLLRGGNLDLSEMVDFVCVSWNQIINYLLQFNGVVGNNLAVEI